MTDFLSAIAPRATFDRHLTLAEQKKLLAHIHKFADPYARRDRAWIRLALYTGFRLGNLRRFTVGDARAALSARKVRAAAEFAKRGHGYDVPLHKNAEQALRDALAVRKAMRLPDDDSAPLFCSREGHGMAERTYQQRIRKWGVSAGLAVAVSAHWLRHTYAKRVIASTEHRDPLRVTQALLGHRSIYSTAIYTLPDREDLVRAVEAMP